MFLYRIEEKVKMSGVLALIGSTRNILKLVGLGRHSLRRFSQAFHCEIQEGDIESCYMSNGMHLICEHKNSLITTVGCIVPAGSMMEIDQERGSSLFLEHLLFRRTKQRDMRQLEEALFEIGGRLSAKAMRDAFIFYGTVPRCEEAKMVKILIDVIIDGTLCEEDLLMEKPVVLREIDETGKSAEKVIMEYFPNVAFQDTVLAQGVHPETRAINDLYINDLICFKERVFKPCCMTMVSTGNLSLCDLEKLVCEHFPNICIECECLAGAKRKYTPQTCYRFTGADLRIRDDDHELGYVGIGVEGPSYRNLYDRLTMEVAKRYIGSWDKSCGGANHNAPYIAHVSFNTDLCVSYKSFILDWLDASIWGCYFVASKINLETMSLYINSEWLRLSLDITEKEVRRAANQCKTAELMKLNDPIQRFHDIVNYIYRHGCYIPMQGRMEIYESICAETIRKVSQKYLYNQCPAVIALGRIENLTDYTRIRARMYSLYF